jgi:uncharacterized protein YdeI (YjbR/CyaY-like superfamily)
MQMSFRGVLHADGEGLHWVTVRIPFDPHEVWPERARMRIKGTIKSPHTHKDFAFHSSLFGSKEKGYVILVNKQMQKGAGVAAGGVADFVLEPDLDERSATPPPELVKLLKADRAVKKWYEQLSYSMRKDIARTITEPKSAEVRIRRAEQLVERMMLAMEGEQELPPILQVAFRRQTRARAGWEAMTPIQRRTHLLGIFYYQSIEARQKRVDKTVEECLRVAKRRASDKPGRSLEEIDM